MVPLHDREIHQTRRPGAALTAVELGRQLEGLPEVDPAELPAILRLLATAAATLACRLATTPHDPVEADHLVTAKEAAALLHCSTDHVYRARSLQAARIKDG